MTVSDKDLIQAATEARKNAYSAYSGYSVGAAIVDDQERLHLGCNIENAAYPLGNCAETSAIAAMVLEGGKCIDRIAIVGGKGEPSACTPCGGCRQRLFEFADDNTVVIVLDDNGEWRHYPIAELLPAGFRLS